jgi:hypothetical protein
MKQTISPPRKRATRHPRLHAAPALLLLLSLLAGGLFAQPAVTLIEPGKLLHVRLTNYSFTTSKSDQDEVRRTSADPGLELVYEKVGEAGRGTRYLVGWQSSIDQNVSYGSGAEKSTYTRVENIFRFGIGKSQAGQYKRLLFRGGIDAYVQGTPGYQSKSKTYNASGSLTQDDDVRGALSFQVAARPFLGVGFKLSDHFALGIEYGIDLGVSTTLGNVRYRYRSTNFEDEQITQLTHVGLFVRNASYLPFLHLSYRF